MIYASIAIFTETIWQLIKELFPGEVPKQADRLGVIALAVYFCWASGANLLGEYAIAVHPIAGAVFTGILCSKGANVFHDLIKKLQAGE